jgi:hypothetical protein
MSREYIFFPLALNVMVGLFFNLTAGDINPLGTFLGQGGWQGCVDTCNITTFNIFSGSIFEALFTGDYTGFISNLFTSSQSAVSFLSITAGLVLVLIGLGIGGAFSFLGSGFSFNVNEAGTRLAQTVGVGLLLWGSVTALFGGWQDVLGFGVGLTLNITLITMFVLGLFFEAKSTY